MYVCPCVCVTHLFWKGKKESILDTLSEKNREKSRQARQGRGKIQEEITSFLD